MANFVHHEPCPSCGSRDNLARYDDGSAFCFGCRYYESPNIQFIMEKGDSKAKDQSDIHNEARAWTSDLGPEAVGWLGKYEIDVPTALLRGFQWHPYRQQLVFPFTDAEGRLEAFQARNFGPGAKQRYWTQGDVNNILPIYFKGESRTKTLVLVEDVVSAVKCSTYLDAMPCLGSGVPPDKLKRLAKLYGNFVVWLDSNMMKNAMKMCERLDYMGAFTSLVHTPLDPKEYTYVELATTLERFCDSW